MKAFGKRLVERNYKKRIIAILIAVAVLIVATAILIPTTLHKQISEYRALEEAQKKQEETVSADQTVTAGETEDDEDEEREEDEKNERHKRVVKEREKRDREVKANEKNDGKENDKEAILSQLTPVGIGVKVGFAVVAFLALVVGVFYWITVAEWLYKMAVLHGMNRALWPILGLIGNVIVVAVMLIVICNPLRVEKTAE